MGPNEMGQAYRAWDGNSSQGGRPFTYVDRIHQAQQVEDAEDLDINAAIHGNWTMQNAKSKMHQFMQTNKINADYSYKTIGPHHTRFE
jgi:ATP-dependent RNA helicase A